MTSRRFAIIAAGLCGTAILVGCVIAALSIWWPTQRIPTHRQSRTSRRKTGSEAESAAAPMTAIAEASLQEFFAARSATTRGDRGGEHA